MLPSTTPRDPASSWNTSAASRSTPCSCVTPGSPRHGRAGCSASSARSPRRQRRVPRHTETGVKRGPAQARGARCVNAGEPAEAYEAALEEQVAGPGPEPVVENGEAESLGATAAPGKGFDSREIVHQLEA